MANKKQKQADPLSGLHNQKCRSMHFGPWMIESDWLENAVDMVRRGVITAEAPMPQEDPLDEPDLEPTAMGRVAIVKIEGAMMKAQSKFGGTCSTVQCRAQIREAASNDSVDAILLLIDSPGGTVAGLDSLAQDVVAARAQKPVYAHVEDCCASAAYYVASQCDRITAARTSLVGCLGSMMVITDSSGAAAQEGLKVHKLTSDKGAGMKGAGAAGTEITPEQLKYYQGIVDVAGEHFKQAVMSGRGLDREKVDALFDGRVHDAEYAKQLGLIDEVASVDAAMGAILTEVSQMNEQEKAELSAKAREDGHKAGLEAGIKQERDRVNAIVAASGARSDLALAAIKDGHNAEQVKITAAALDTAEAKHKTDLEAANKKTADAEAAAKLAQEQAALAAKGQPALKMKQGAVDGDSVVETAKSEGRLEEHPDGKRFNYKPKWGRAD